MQMEKEFSFKNYFLYLVRKWLIIAICVVIGAVGGIIYAFCFSDDTKYEVYETTLRLDLNKYIEMNGEDDIWINAKSKSFFWSSNDRVSDCFDWEIEEFESRIPIENPYIAHFETHRSIDAKRFIKVLMQIYPELYIDVDKNEFRCGTAQEYLDK